MGLKFFGLWLWLRLHDLSSYLIALISFAAAKLVATADPARAEAKRLSS
jgi:hypothetical protein